MQTAAGDACCRQNSSKCNELTDQRDTAQYDNRQDITPEISGSGSAVETVIFGRDHGLNVFHNRFEIGSLESRRDLIVICFFDLFGNIVEIHFSNS